MLYKLETFVSKVVEVLEILLAVLILIVLAVLVCMEVYAILANPEIWKERDFLEEFLTWATTVVIAVEFVRMLMHPSANNILELLIMAISRSVILHHDNYMGVLISMICIIGLFAARRFLIPRREAKEDMVHES